MTKFAPGAKGMTIEVPFIGQKPLDILAQI